MKRNERATRFMATALVLGATGSTASCLRVNDEHCMFRGGDDACGDRYCVAAAGLDVSADRNGCSEQEPDLTEPRIAYLRYGVVGETELEQVRMDLGIDEGCAEWPPMTRSLLDIEKHLRSQEKKVSRGSAVLDSTQGGLINGLILDIDEAVRACGGGGTTGTTMGEETSTTAGTEAGSESSTTGPVPCMGNDECPDDTPFCNPEMMTCVVDCDGMPDPHAACAGMSPETPVCLDGVCVQCTPELPDACTGMTPVCDAEMNTCVPCTAHEQCGDAACNFFTGACLPDDQVVHVGPGQMYTTLTAAIDDFEEMKWMEGTVVVHAGPPDYNESLTLNDGQVIAFLAAELGPGIEPPVWVRTSGNASQLTVNAGTTVLLDGIQLSINASNMVPGLRVNGGGQAWLDRSRVIANNGGGILAHTDATLVLRNCFVGGSVNNVPALELNGSTARILYTTVGAGFGAAPALLCDTEATADVRNSLFVAENNDPEVVQCPLGTIQHSVAEMPLGGTNTDLRLDMSTSWFNNYGVGDFHLDPLAPVVLDTAALWHLGDPPTDIDGDPRPTTDDTLDVAGADVP